MPHVRSFALCLLVACKSGNPTETDTDSDTDDTDVSSTADTASVVGTADTAPPEPPPIVDCTSLPATPAFSRLQAPRAYHGLAFDDLGGLVGNDNTSMIRAVAPNDASLWIPNVGGAQQMDYLPNGDLVVASTTAGRIVKVSAAGGSTVLASGINAYGVEVGPDGMVYTANQNVVHRIDPVAGGAEVFIPAGQISAPKVVNFSPDGTVMYVGTNNGSGSVHQIPLDANFEPSGPPTLLANTGGSWHDGLGIDACGNLYVAEYFTRSLYLITPDGDVSTLLDYYDVPGGGSGYGHGVQFGNGVGSWSDHNIYVPLPYDGNRVAELEVGIPSKDFNGGYYEVVR